MTAFTLCDAALCVLTTHDPNKKAHQTRDLIGQWHDGTIDKIGLSTDTPSRPARPEKPALLEPNEMPKRGKAGSLKSKKALLHALAHIELNAIDLAWDIMARFSYLSEENTTEGFTLPREFFDDWCKVADDEAKHFLLLNSRMNDFDINYGDLPAHDGLWESSEKTAHDFAARLAVVPMVLEARGLDVTPSMIDSMKKFDDPISANILQTIHDDEITHVRAGTVWFESWCQHYNLDIETTWQNLVQTFFYKTLKPPFNHPSRHQAGMLRHWYEPLVEDEPRNRAKASS